MITVRCGPLVGRKLPPDILWYRARTIAELAEVLIADGEPLWSGPVPIKPTGTRRPLFCPHTIGGNLFFYDNIARHLHEDQPLYGLPARGTDGIERPDSAVEAMAAHCIDNMRRVQPRGPYLLAGDCSAAPIAYEMACQLHAQGETVDLLALCDSLAPGFHPRELMRTVWKSLRARNFRSIQQRLYRLVLQNLGLGRLRRFRTLGEAHYWALFSYRPGSYTGRAVVIKGLDLEYARRPGLGWEKLARGGVATCVVPAVHGDIVTEPAVRVLAQRLEMYLARTAAPALSDIHARSSHPKTADVAISS